VLSYAQHMGYLIMNPADRVERPRDDTEEHPVYTREQIRVLLETAKADRVHALWYLAISTGLRRSELAGLKWEDIDLGSSQPVLMVRRNRTMADNRVVDSIPKPRAGWRTIVLDRGTATLLAEHCASMVLGSGGRCNNLTQRLQW
jgi:integrase